MKMTTKIALFLLSNTLGLWTHSIMVVLFVLSGIVDLTEEPYRSLDFADWFSVRVLFCAIVCLVFSFSGFFLRGKWRLFFLTAPAVVPFIFGAFLFASI